MVTITGFVALILVAVAVATSAVLGGVLQQNLDNKVGDSTSVAADQYQLLTRNTALLHTVGAEDVLNLGHFPAGFLFFQQAPTSQDAAYINSDGRIVALSTAQRAAVVQAFNSQNGRLEPVTVEIPDLGAYRLQPRVLPNNQYIVVGGLPLSELNETVTQILVTVALVTAGGLLLLGSAIAVIIRVGLRPLRAVAETATRVATLPMAEGEVSISERVPVDEADDRTEIGRVGAALNTLLDHVDSSLAARQRNEERMRTFVADASHELRTPLASIRGYSELSLRALQQAPPELAAETTSSSLERIQAQSLRMTTLVEDLLLLARLDEGQELVYGQVDLTRLIVEAVSDAGPAGPEHVWLLDLAEEPISISGDAGRLQQVVANLLANALTHTPEGTCVTVGLHKERGQAVITVHDDGPGIDPAIGDELFERFSRGDRSRARKTGGTGLGLSIARAIVEAHRGTISVQSVPGDTTFTVRLPMRQPKAG
ncbi:ATP-binding protein [Microbacterium sp. ASV49]|uniref:histidine kinase n=2 Tax=Microbacterium candidum TaxID=3041922 RepID=A0ABT7N1V6_9MICO|nr:HAMP domain-containing sensor histidine kinase [Microbacterium sp. ASV49]MDL9980690.1 ATP-binding protein [Microbacterium sp. ASV49]